MLSIFVITLLLGAVVGLLAGLLGIGGGLIVVPTLVMMLPAFDVVSSADAMLVAVATSLASIIITATSSVRAHHKLGNVPWHIALSVVVGAGIGAWSVGYYAHHIGGELFCGRSHYASPRLIESSDRRKAAHLRGPLPFFRRRRCNQVTT